MNCNQRQHRCTVERANSRRMTEVWVSAIKRQTYWKEINSSWKYLYSLKDIYLFLFADNITSMKILKDSIQKLIALTSEINKSIQDKHRKIWCILIPHTKQSKEEIKREEFSIFFYLAKDKGSRGNTEEQSEGNSRKTELLDTECNLTTEGNNVLVYKMGTIRLIVLDLR